MRNGRLKEHVGTTISNQVLNCKRRGDYTGETGDAPLWNRDQASSDARCMILLSENGVKYELYIRQSDPSLSMCIIDRPPAVPFFLHELI